MRGGLNGRVKKYYRTEKYGRDYLRRGFVPIPVPLGKKNPGYRNWTKMRLTPEEWDELSRRGDAINISLLLGEPSGWLTDVDADVPEAVTVADSFLPRTVTSGRENSPCSHRWYRSYGAKNRKWLGLNGEVLLEVRSTGLQTLVEPSIHPEDGDRYMWDRRNGMDLTEVSCEDLVERCNKVATATLIARHLPLEGGRHDFAMALAGYLLGAGRLDEETVLDIMLVAWHAADADTRDAVRDIESIVRDTARKVVEGEPVVGGPTLDDIVPGVTHRLAKWWGWRREPLPSGSASASAPQAAGAPTSNGLRVALTPVLLFPLNALPTTLRRYVEEAAAAVGCPPEFIALPMLATLGAAIGNSYILVVKKGWEENTTIYVAVVADPGSKKSPASSKAYIPAREKQADHKREYECAMELYWAERAQWEVDKKEAREAGEPVPNPPQEPTMRRTVVSDATIEALVVRLEENPRGVLCAHDELSGWVKSLDQYKQGGRGSERQQWLSMWGGEPIYVDRKGKKEPHVVPCPLVCLSGSIQPPILPELGNNREDGLLDRFLLSYPDRMPSRWSDDEISDETAEAWRKTYHALYDLEVDVNANGEPTPKRLEFTPEACEVFIGKTNSLHEEMEHPRFPTYLRGPWAKLEAYLARLSLIIALVRIVDSEPRYSNVFWSVSGQDVRAAAQLIDYFKSHARRVYARLYRENPDNLLLLALESFLKEQGEYWEGMSSELFEIMKDHSAPGLPGGEVPFGKLLRKITNDPDNDLVLKEGWRRGNQPIIKLSLSTLGSLGDVGLADAETTEGTESRNEGEKATANHPDSVIHEEDQIEEVLKMS